MWFGYKLSSEERSARQLVQDAQAAEAAGFDFAALSDHFHPWLDSQGESPFAWTVLGAVATATERLVVGTAVTCPFIRVHPTTVAQAAATVAALMPGRFFLGLGTGERLNEHVVGRGWPGVDERREALDASIEAIRELWSGQIVTSDRAGVVVDAARLYSLPDVMPPIYVAASGPKSAALAGERADGLISTSPDPDLVARFTEAGGRGPAIGELTVCLAPSEDQALATVLERWPIPALEGDATTELATPDEFARAGAEVDPEKLRSMVPLGPDLDQVVEAVAKYGDAGFSHVILHQVGDDQTGFIRTCEERLLPALRDAFGIAGAEPQLASR